MEIATLPDYLSPGLRLVFVGINPGLYSAQHGHYFARPTNRFWPAFSRSRLSLSIRKALGREMLGQTDDARLLQFGIGFTDVVKRPTRNASELNSIDFSDGARLLLAKLERFQPTVVCFHGVTGGRAFALYALNDPAAVLALGPQSKVIGRSRIYVVPNPSPANAHFTLADQADWYDRLAGFLDDLERQTEITC